MDFEQAEKSFKQIKAQFVSGTLNESDFKTRLEELMVQDDQGGWWMIGYETERSKKQNRKSLKELLTRKLIIKLLKSLPKS